MSKRGIRITPSITDRSDESLKSYFRDVSRIPLLTPEEEKIVARKAKEGDRKAIQKLIESNLRFVISVAKQYQGKGLPLVDLVQEGNYGLVQSIRLFDPDKGYKFISYAVWWIRQAIIKALADQCRTIRIPLSQTSKNGKLAKVIEQFEQVEGRKPTSEELSAYVDMNEREINNALSSYNRIVSLTTPFNDDEVGCLLDVVPNNNSELSDANEERKDNNKILEEILSKLPYRDRDILRMSLGLGIMPMQNEEIANRFGIGYERVRQIIQHAIEYLRENCMEDFKELV